MPLSEAIKEELLDSLKNCQFRSLCDKYFHEDFLWVIKGTSQLSGIYTDKEQFFTYVIDRLNALIAPGWKMHILENYFDPEKNAFIVEMKGEAKTITGGFYNNEYCWIFQFDQNIKVKKLTAYYDSLLVDRTLESKSA